jgi:hypothetical protein
MVRVVSKPDKTEIDLWTSPNYTTGTARKWGRSDSSGSFLNGAVHPRLMETFGIDLQEESHQVPGLVALSRLQPIGALSKTPRNH